MRQAYLVISAVFLSALCTPAPSMSDTVRIFGSVKRVTGRNTIVLDGGSRNGFKEGQEFVLLRNRKHFRKEPAGLVFIDDWARIGQVRIESTAPLVSSALVISMENRDLELNKEDKVGEISVTMTPSKPNYQETQKPATISSPPPPPPAEKQVEIKTEQVPVSGVGEALISSDPLEAEVYIDGELYPEPTPVTIPEMKAGNHTIILKKPGFYAEETVFIKPKETTWINIKLKKK